jgi:hypothetical protein
MISQAPRAAQLAWMAFAVKQDETPRPFRECGDPVIGMPALARQLAEPIQQSRSARRRRRLCLGFREDCSRTHGILRKVLSKPMPALMYIRTLFNVKDRQENMDELPGTNDSRAGVGAMLSATQHSRAGAGICNLRRSSNHKLGEFVRTARHTCSESSYASSPSRAQLV